jgi:hypothetical protein
MGRLLWEYCSRSEGIQLGGDPFRFGRGSAVGGIIPDPRHQAAADSGAVRSIGARRLKDLIQQGEAGQEHRRSSELESV